MHYIFPCKKCIIYDSGKGKNMQIKTFSSFNPKHAALYDQILDLTKPINDTYPEHTKWFMQKFIPGLQKKNECILLHRMRTILWLAVF